MVSKFLTVHTSFHRYLQLSPSNSLHLASVIFRNKKMTLLADDF